MTNDTQRIDDSAFMTEATQRTTRINQAGHIDNNTPIKVDQRQSEVLPTERIGAANHITEIPTPAESSVPEVPSRDEVMPDKATDYMSPY